MAIMRVQVKLEAVDRFDASCWKNGASPVSLDQIMGNMIFDVVAPMDALFQVLADGGNDVAMIPRGN